MLSLQDCKKHLKTDEFTDEQIEQIRESLHQLAELFITEYLKTRKKPTHESNHLLLGVDQGTS